VTSLAYQLGALLLLIPYAFAATPRNAFAAAAVVAVVALLAIGAGKTWVTKERPVQAALELAGLGILACVIGLVLGWVVGVAV
jgi:VIT1/CCC1 family predicted Fe2+/Mn2+ transporter